MPCAKFHPRTKPRNPFQVLVAQKQICDRVVCRVVVSPHLSLPGRLSTDKPKADLGIGLNSREIRTTDRCRHSKGFPSALAPHERRPKRLTSAVHDRQYPALPNGKNADSANRDGLLSRLEQTCYRENHQIRPLKSSRCICSCGFACVVPRGATTIERKGHAI